MSASAPSRTEEGVLNEHVTVPETPPPVKEEEKTIEAGQDHRIPIRLFVFWINLLILQTNHTTNFNSPLV